MIRNGTTTLFESAFITQVKSIDTHGEKARRKRLRRKSRKSVSPVSSVGRICVRAIRGGCEGMREGLITRARR